MTEAVPRSERNLAPVLVVARGPTAELCYLDYLTARLRNRHTRRAYAWAGADFAAFAEARGLG